MRRNVLQFSTILLLSFALAFAQNPVPSTKASYETMVEKIKAGDKSVDFRELRLAYMESETRKKFKDTSGQTEAMKQGLREKNYKKAIRNAEEVLRENFVDMDAHYAEYIAYRELQDTDLAEHQKDIFEGLLRSITSSGDGKSAETAFQVIEIHEEYVVLGSMGLMPSKQSLQHKDDHSYDVMEAIDPNTNEKVTLYFNVDIPFAHYMK